MIAPCARLRTRQTLVPGRGCNGPVTAPAARGGLAPRSLPDLRPGRPSIGAAGASPAEANPLFWGAEMPLAVTALFVLAWMIELASAGIGARASSPLKRAPLLVFVLPVTWGTPGLCRC